MHALVYIYAFSHGVIYVYAFSHGVIYVYASTTPLPLSRCAFQKKLDRSRRLNECTSHAADCAVRLMRGAAGVPPNGNEKSRRRRA